MDKPFCYFTISNVSNIVHAIHVHPIIFFFASNVFMKVYGYKWRALYWNNTNSIKICNKSSSLNVRILCCSRIFQLLVLMRNL